MVDRRERTILYDIYQQGFSLLGLDCLQTRIPAVSYTHLDVYKRQVDMSNEDRLNMAYQRAKLLGTDGESYTNIWVAM